MGRNNKFLGRNIRLFLFINLCVSGDPLVTKPWNQTGHNEKETIPATKTVLQTLFIQQSDEFTCLMSSLQIIYTCSECPLQKSGVSSNPSHVCCGLCPASNHSPPSTSQAEFASSCTKPCAIHEQGQREAQIRTSSGNHLINKLLLNKTKERMVEPQPRAGQ